MNPLEKEIALQDPTGTKDSFTFTEKELLVLLNECVEFEKALWHTAEQCQSGYDAGYEAGYDAGFDEGYEEAA